MSADQTACPRGSVQRLGDRTVRTDVLSASPSSTVTLASAISRWVVATVSASSPIGASINSAQVTPGSSVVVFGCGGVGISAIQGARIAGASAILAVDTMPNKLEQAKHFGATHVTTPDGLDSMKQAITGGEGELDVRLCQLVRLTRDGEPVKMSKRSGSFVTLAEVVEEVGKDVVRFIMLTRKNDAPLDFDFAKVVEQSRDNPVFYVQYAHARIRSVFRNVADELPGADLDDAALSQADLRLLSDEAELGLMKVLADWPRAVEAAALAHEPHRIAFYLYDLAASFHSYWNKGKEDPTLRFIRTDEPALTAARLALIQAAALTIASGLGVLGVTPAEEMR